MTEAPKTAPPDPRRRLRWALVVSLAVNLALIGLMAGAVLQDRGRTGQRGIDLSMGPIGAALDAESRAEIGRDIAGRIKPVEQRRAMQRSFEDIKALLRAETFDAAAFAAAIAAPQARMKDIREAATAALVARVAAMTPAERQELADRISLRPPRRN